MRLLDLFSGIGGFSLGLERAGMRTVRFCEIDPYCRKVLAKHWPDVSCHDDITTMRFEEGEADVICAGWPCQDISVAGRGAGIAGARSGLFRELVRAVRVVRPRYILLEMAALLSRGMGTVLGELAESGYDAQWDCIPASSVGAPHRRDRVWIVADARHGLLSKRARETRGQVWEWIAERQLFGGDGAQGFVADSIGTRLEGRAADGSDHAEECQAAERSRAVPDTAHELLDRTWNAGPRRWPKPSNCGWWELEPDVGRMVDGLPNRVHRLRALGNAVVPQIPELVGRAIME